MNFEPDELRDALGEPHPELFAPVEEDFDTMFECPLRMPSSSPRTETPARERESEPSFRDPHFQA